MFFFEPVAALIMTIVAVFATSDIESLVDSEVWSLDWPADATQTTTSTKQTNQTKTTNKLDAGYPESNEDN